MTYNFRKHIIQCCNMQITKEENSQSKIPLIDQNELSSVSSSHQNAPNSNSVIFANSSICSRNSKNIRKPLIKGLDFSIGPSQILSSVNIQNSSLHSRRTYNLTRQQTGDILFKDQRKCNLKNIDIPEANNNLNSSPKTEVQPFDIIMLQKNEQKKKLKKMNKILSQKKNNKKQNKQNSFISQERTSSDSRSIINESRFSFIKPKNVTFDQEFNLIIQNRNGSRYRADQTLLNIKKEQIRLRNEIIKGIQLQQPQKYKFLLEFYTTQSQIKLKIQKNNVTSSNRFILHELENPKQKHYYSFDMSHQPVQIMDITRFRWEGLVKLKLKSTFLCDNDWMVIVQKSQNFPDLEELNLGKFFQYFESNYIQNVSQQQLIKLQKGMRLLKVLCLIQNRIRDQYIQQIQKFAKDQGIQILINETVRNNDENFIGLHQKYPFNHNFPQQKNIYQNNYTSAQINIDKSNRLVRISEPEGSQDPSINASEQPSELIWPKYRLQNSRSLKKKMISSSSKEILSNSSFFSSVCSESSLLSSVSSKECSFQLRDYSFTYYQDIRIHQISHSDISTIDKYDIQNLSFLSSDQDFLYFWDNQQEMETISLKIPEYKILLINLTQIGSDRDQHKRFYIETLEKVLQIEKIIFGMQSNTVAIRLNNIGCIYWSYGDLQNAMDCYFKCRQILIQDIDKKLIDVPILNINSSVQMMKRDYQKEIFNLRGSMSIITKILGPESITMGTILNNIGSVYVKQGDNQKALAIFCRALLIETITLGASSIDSAIILKNIGNVFRKIGYQNSQLIF